MKTAINGSEKDLLCKSGAETEAALKAAAQSVRQVQAPVGMNPQRQDKQKVKGDKSQNELTQINKKFSVLKMTEKLKVRFIEQKTSRTRVLRGITFHKEMCPAVRKADTAPPAQSREITSPREVMLEITEDDS